MKRLQPSTLRTSIVLLVLLAMLPALGLMLYTARVQQEIAVEQAEEDAQVVAQLIAADQARLIEDTRNMLGALATLVPFRLMDQPTCTALLVGVLKQYPAYTGLWVNGADGALICNSSGNMALGDASASAWFQRVIAERSFAVGDFQIGPASGKAVLSMGYPIFDERGVVTAMVAAALDLSRVEQSLVRSHLPEGATLTVIDRNGTVLARYPSDGVVAGEPAPDAALTETMLAKETGTAAATGRDGVRRLYGFAPLDEETRSAFLQIGLPEAMAFHQARDVYRRALGGLIAVTVVAAAAAWFGGGALIVRRLRRLVTVTQRLHAGDLSARAGRSRSDDEIGRLACAFDEMAAALQERDRALRRSEQRYSLLATNFPNGAVFLFDAELRFTLVGGLGRHGELSNEEMVGRPIREVIAPETWSDVEPLVRAVLAGEEGAVESRYRDHVRVIRAVPIRDDAGAVTGGLAILQDITDLKRAEEAARANEERLARTIETMAEGVVIYDPEGRFSLINAAAAQILGVERDRSSLHAALTQKWERFHLDGRPMAREEHAFECVRRTNAPVRGAQYVLANPDGRRQILSVNAAPLHDADGAFVGAVASMVDVTAEHEMRQTLERNEARFRALVQNASDVILVVDPDSTIRYVSPAVERVLGYRPEELLGTPGVALLAGDDALVAERVLEESMDVLGSGRPLQFHVRHRSGDWRVLELIGTNLLHEPAIEGFVINAWDITERKNVESQLANALKLLEADMTRAAEVQANLLPREAPRLDGFELAGHCLPARDVGGDFYDWHSGTSGTATVTLADVMGKGMSAALLMATVRSAMRAVVRDSTPAVAMRYVTRTLNDDLDNSDRFVTLFLGQLDIASRQLTYVDAGHGFAFMRRADGSVEALGPRGLPLGIPVEEGYEEHAIGFRAGDALILYSDGLLDARPDIGLDHAALAAVLDGATSAEEMVGRLTALAAGGEPLPDDLTVVVLRCTED